MATEGLGVAIKADLREIERDFRHLGQNILPRIAANALNRTNRGLRTDLTRGISARFQIKPQRRVRSRVRIPRNPKFRATPQRLSAGGVALGQFVPAHWINRGNTRPNVPGAFQIEIDGKRLWVVRKTRARYPLKLALVDIQAAMMQTTDQIIETKGADRWRRAAESQLRRYL